MARPGIGNSLFVLVQGFFESDCVIYLMALATGGGVCHRWRGAPNQPPKGVR